MRLVSQGTEPTESCKQQAVWLRHIERRLYAKKKKKKKEEHRLLLGGGELSYIIKKGRFQFVSQLASARGSSNHVPSIFVCGAFPFSNGSQ